MGMAAAGQRMYPSSSSMTVTSASENSAAKKTQLSSAWFSEWKTVQNGEGECDREDCHIHTLTRKAGFTSKRLLLFSILGRTSTCPARQASAGPASSPDLCLTPWLLTAAISLHPCLTFSTALLFHLHPCPRHALLGRPGSKSISHVCIRSTSHTVSLFPHANFSTWFSPHSYCCNLLIWFSLWCTCHNRDLKQYLEAKL